MGKIAVVAHRKRLSLFKRHTPVLDAKPVYLHELAYVGGNKNEFVGKRGPRDQYVVRSNRLRSFSNGLIRRTLRKFMISAGQLARSAAVEPFSDRFTNESVTTYRFPKLLG